MHQRIGRIDASSFSGFAPLQGFHGQQPVKRQLTGQQTQMSDARDDMIQVLTDELTNFLLSEPDNACRMSDIHRFAEISTYKPPDFGCRWIDLLPTIEAVAIKGEGLNKVICLRPNSSDQPGSLQDPINTEADQMKQVMIEELREFLFFKLDQEWKMNEIQGFSWTSTSRSILVSDGTSFSQPWM